MLVGTPRARANGFGALDYLIVAIYFAAMIGMGFYFSRRETSTEAFFLGGRSVPWWAVGLSIFGTSISSITYLAIPAKAYATDWIFLVGNLTIILIVPLITWFYIPAFRRAPITTAYEYLEVAFNLAIRIYGSIVFLLFQAGRIAIVLYLPALVLSAATGLSVEFSILTMGPITMLYTVVGGMEAVIWTDVVQSFVLIGGALLALIIAIAHIDGGISGLATMATAAGKTHWFEFATDYSTPAIWGLRDWQCVRDVLPEHGGPDHRAALPYDLDREGRGARVDQRRHRAGIVSFLASARRSGAISRHIRNSWIRRCRPMRSCRSS